MAVSLPGTPADIGKFSLARLNPWSLLVNLVGEDTTDWETLAQLRCTPLDGALRATCTVETAYSGNVEWVRLSLDSDQTRSLDITEFVGDFQKLDADGKPERTYFTFAVAVGPNVSDPEALT